MADGVTTNYDKAPFVPVSAATADCSAGWRNVAGRLRSAVGRSRATICVECYPGVIVEEVEQSLAEALRPARVLRSADCLRSSSEIERLLAKDLTDDPVFGRLNGVRIEDFMAPERLETARRAAAGVTHGLVLIIGTGAVVVEPRPDLLVYADMARWEIQQRQRREETGNLGADNLHENAALKYKRAFFVDWRVADRVKKALLPRLDFLLDTNDRAEPKMISGAMLRQGLRAAVQRPFRVVPFFDAGPWGGQWMKRVCDLPDGPPNYAWGFDCVPEENSLLLGFGSARVEIPSIDLVFAHPRELLGDPVHARFGAEFPIRFDFLDTMQGGNLSLQVHPLTEYIQDHFGMHYTQDESYYILDAEPGAQVYLGLKEGIHPSDMRDDLERAQEGVAPFPAERYVNRWNAAKHSHFLIPAGTVHCSGKDCMVLEISATPYIFTFKLWDWDRPDLNGRPRPIHLAHGMANIQWDRTTRGVRRNLVNRIQPLACGEGWREERTGLHEREFIETRRHWFTGEVEHDTAGGVNVLNLVEGDCVVVESPDAAFEPFVVHYAETFIVPAAVGRYRIRPLQPRLRPCATVKAFVRVNA